MRKIIKKADILLFVILLLLGIGLSVASFSLQSGGANVVIAVDGKVYGTYSLNKDQTIEIEQNGHYNRVEIKDGHVQMMESSCDNQICVMQGPISTHYIPIVCLPNKVVVEVLDDEE